LFVDKDGRIFHHHDLWECWKHGLYKTKSKNEEKSQKSFLILNSVENCDASFKSLIENWPYSSQVNLSNKSINRQAWLGQAACCFSHGANEDETKIAWFKLTIEEQNRANQVADYYITKFELEVMNAQKKTRNERIGRCPRTYTMDL